MPVLQGLKRLFGAVRQGEEQRVLHTHLTDDQVLDEKPGPPLESGSTYFSIHLDEIRLGFGRKWSTTFLPMVTVVTEFSHDHSRLEVPFVVGPERVSAAVGGAVPNQMTIEHVDVTGPHPYRGNGIGLTVVLHQVPVSDLAKELLDSATSLAGSVDVFGSVTPALKVAQAVADTVGALLGLQGTTPLGAVQHDINPQVGNGSVTGSYALVLAGDVRPEHLWVRERSLLVGETRESATPARGLDFVLYRVMATSLRDDAESLPVMQPLSGLVSRFAAMPDRGSFEVAKAILGVLGQLLVLSPDLTEHQARELYGAVKARMVAERDEAAELANLGGSPGADDQTLILRNVALDALGTI